MEQMSHSVVGASFIYVVMGALNYNAYIIRVYNIVYITRAPVEDTLGVLGNGFNEYLIIAIII